MNGLPKQLARQRMRPRTSDVRGEYFRDQTAIIHSTPFRRLKHKTQVFFAPENDHICTRIEHVLHVATIAATMMMEMIDFRSTNLEIRFLMSSIFYSSYSK